MSERTALYRLYNDSDTLLYVGISHQPEVRWTRHLADKAWWPTVRRFTVDWYATREDALAEETRAIKAERPLHNVANVDWRPIVDTGQRGMKVSNKPGKAYKVNLRMDKDLWDAFGLVVGDAKRSVLIRDFIRSIVEEADVA